ncbi:MAG: thiamine phosphate synthase [Alphaproteobacteria bacterium]
MLPSICVLSDSKSADKKINDILKQCIDNGANWIAIREYDLDESELQNLCEEIIKYGESTGTLISVWNNSKIAEDLQIGLHQSIDNLDTSIKNNLGYDSPLGVSTHNETEMTQARGSDYITLSPVFDSISKNGYTGFGLDKLSSLAMYSNTPVFAMGGIDESNIDSVFEAGVYGAFLCGSVMKNPDILKSLNEYL